MASWSSLTSFLRLASGQWFRVVVTSCAFFPFRRRLLPNRCLGATALLRRHISCSTVSMLRRRSLKPKPDLKRHKSTSSAAQGVILEHLDPVLAHRDAHIAAWEACARAQNRTMAEIPLFPMTPQSSPQHRPSELTAAGQDSRDRGDAQDLRRRQSVRFMGPCSTQTAIRGPHASGSSKDRNRDSTDTQEGGHEISNQPTNEDQNEKAPSPPSRVPPPVPLPHIAAGYLDALAAAEEYYTPQDDIASAPSSYRRLYRSRSMFTDSPGNKSVKLKPPPPLASRRFFRSDPSDVKPPHDDTAPALRTPKSMSFLSSRRSQSRFNTNRDRTALEPTPSSLSGVPENASLITEKSMPRLRYKSSIFFGSLSHQAGPKMHHKTLRGSSFTEDLGKPSSTPHSHSEQSSTLRLRARNVSRSLRIKLKGLFSGAKSEDGAGSIPCQHIEAQRSHVTPIRTSSADDKSPIDGGDELTRSPLARVSTFRMVPPELGHTSKASRESLTNEQDRIVSDGSSLTSWVHSGPSTLTSQEQQQWREWEKQRLSVIRENGAHAPSPSIRRRVLGPGVFQPPDRAAKVPVAGGPMVDSQRIYSALVKRMQATNTETAQSRGPERLALAGEEVGEHCDKTPDTIRHVIPERKYLMASRDIHTPTRSSKKASLSRKPNHENEEVDNRHAVSYGSPSGHQGRRNVDFTDERPASATAEVASLYKGSQLETEMDSNNIMIQQSARLDWSRVSGSPASHLFRAGSPYRRALRKSMEEEQNAWAQSSVNERDSDTGTQVHHASDGGNVPETDSDSAKDLDYSESVYSSDEVANRNSAANTPAMYRPGGRRETSTVSSVDWKTWLSANVDKLEPAPSPCKPSSHAERALPAISRKLHTTAANRFPSLRGHIREQAQIDDDDRDRVRDYNNENVRSGDADDVFQSTPTQKPVRKTTPSTTTLPSTTAATPLSPVPVQPNITTNPSPLRHSLSANKRATPPTHPSRNNYERGAEVGGCGGGGNRSLLVENESPTRAPPPPPPIPPRSKMRPEPLRIVRASPGPVGGYGLHHHQQQQHHGLG
ncbi:hypothetical protein CHGG_06381 [Chaetomium globosum CBS 148.51]|uniref:DUF4048 domain-containing protein n=1 Tax=Chaetomium globosum (strain ATCC 6205 / CBS 148.51 / DSM 1962 / NBRC 6347 / NRRL 1970) TaxID=306901 RepID=Q2H4N4_CHAGB|nr:uncharacterized protein CHGG_06381 [Chaetomium globosum CBS 148.51]EAQ89762.1 hypothetical protein CHGG_06381 [Chaetomium globosum CBS 148.51]